MTGCEQTEITALDEYENLSTEETEQASDEELCDIYDNYLKDMDVRR